MHYNYVIIFIIGMIFFIIFQLIKMTTTILKLNKTNELNRVQVKEDHQYEFIKGLY